MLEEANHTLGHKVDQLGTELLTLESLREKLEADLKSAHIVADNYLLNLQTSQEEVKAL